MPTHPRDRRDDARIPTPATGRTGWKTCARACALIVACALSAVSAGCDGGGGAGGGSGGGVGGGVGGGTGGGSPAAAEVVLALDAESAGSLAVATFTIAIDEIRLRSDRGFDLDPVLYGVGLVDLVTGDPIVAFSSAPPATYSSVEIVLDGGAEPTLAASLSLDGQPVEVAIDGPIALDFACEAPVPTEPGDVLAIDLDLDLEGLATLLATATLPPEQDGVIVVNASTAPELVDAIVAWLEAGWSASCEIAAETLDSGSVDVSP